jgi:hypothetical protein
MLVKCLAVLGLVVTGIVAQFWGQVEAPIHASGEEATAEADDAHGFPFDRLPELKLIEFRLAADYDWVNMGGRLERKTVGRADSVAYALVDMGHAQAKRMDREAERGEVVFELVSGTGTRKLIEALPHPTSVEQNVVCLAFYPGTGDEFVDPQLVASIDGHKVAEWNLTAFPTDRRVIPADEPLVTEARSVADLDIRASATASAYESQTTRFTGSVSLNISVDGRFDPNCRYWVYYEVPETTWRKESYNQGGGFLVSEPRTTGSSQATEYAAYADRMRVTGRVEKTKVYTETARFSGIEIVAESNSDQFHIVNRSEQRVVLSTGVEVVLPVFDNLAWAADDGTSLELPIDVFFPGGTKDVAVDDLHGLPASLEPVKVRIGKTLGNGMWRGAGGSGGGDSWTTGFRADRDTVVPGSVFDFTMDIEHIVTIAREEFRLLIPIEQHARRRPAPAESDQGSKDRFRGGSPFGTLRTKR